MANRNWTRGAHGEGLYLIVWGVALLAWIPFADALAGVVAVAVLGAVFCYYGVAMIRSGSRTLA